MTANFYNERNIEMVVVVFFLMNIANENFFFKWFSRAICSQLNTEWSQVEVINLINDGSGLGFGIIGGRSTGVVVKTILPGGVADRVSKLTTAAFFQSIL